MNTKEKIQDRALKMFNERGIEYVGLRELAAVLEMRVSNITYYFPTKDDLVMAISQELSASNSKVLVNNPDATMKTFLKMLHGAFENHYEFRGLLRSFVHVMTQNKTMLASYKKVKRERRSVIATTIDTLTNNGYLSIGDEETLNFLVSNIELISRYWISEAAVFNQEQSKNEQIQLYLGLIFNLLLPYSSAKGKKEIKVFKEELANKN